MNPTWSNMETMRAFHILNRDKRVYARAQKAARTGIVALRNFVEGVAQRAAYRDLGGFRDIYSILEMISWDDLAAHIEPNQYLPLERLKLSRAGRELRYMRERAGLDERELGDKIGVSEYFIAAIENGAVIIPDEKVEALSRALNVPFDALAEALLRHYKPDYYRAFFDKDQIETA